MALPKHRSDQPVSEAIPRALVPCPPDLVLAPGQVFALSASKGIPEWGIEACLLDFVLQSTAYPDKRAALETWRIWASQHVVQMWDSSRRPAKPPEPTNPDQLKAARIARRKQLLAEARRSEQERVRAAAERCPPPPEVLALIGGIGSLPKPSPAPRQPGGAAGAAPATMPRTPPPENAPARRRGAPHP